MKRYLKRFFKIKGLYSTIIFLITLLWPVLLYQLIANTETEHLTYYALLFWLLYSYFIKTELDRCKKVLESNPSIRDHERSMKMLEIALEEERAKSKRAGLSVHENYRPKKSSYRDGRRRR